LPPSVELKRPAVYRESLLSGEKGEKIADLVEGLGIRRGVGARRAAMGLVAMSMTLSKNARP